MPGEVLLGYEEKILLRRSGKALEQAVRGGDEVTVPGGAQGKGNCPRKGKLSCMLGKMIIKLHFIVEGVTIYLCMQERCSGSCPKLYMCWLWNPNRKQ